MSHSSNNVPDVLRHYLLMWNERDSEAIRGHLDRAVSEDCLWVDPQHAHVGRDALENNVRRFRRRYKTAEIKLNVDGHHQRYRYEWRIVMDEALLIEGFDVMTLNDEGLIERVDGFFGKLVSI